jgi:hypothetical protein
MSKMSWPMMMAPFVAMGVLALMLISVPWSGNTDHYGT